MDVGSFDNHLGSLRTGSLQDLTEIRHSREDGLWQSMGEFAEDEDADLRENGLGLSPAPSPDVDEAWQHEMAMPHIPKSTATAAEKEKLLSGVDRDLAPFNASGITLEMVEQVYCTYNVQGFRVQIIDGEWFIAGETHNFLTIHLKTKQVLADFAARYKGRLPDVDFVLQTSDWLPPAYNGTHPDCPQQGPIFTANKEKGNPHGILFPDESWVEWARLRWLISEAAHKLPWEEREPKLLFRGGPTGIRPDLLGGPPEELQSDDLDIKLTEWYGEDKGSFMSMPEQCHNRYLLYCEGNTWASRLKQLLLCNSTVVINASPFVGFWWHMLEHGKHVHVMPRLTDNESTPDKLHKVVRQLKADEDRAQRIAQTGYRLAMEVLHPDNAFMYWHRLITRYAELQRFKPTRHPDAIPLERSILYAHQDKLQINFRQRHCNICIPQPEREDRAAAYTSKLFEIDGHAK
ncbi:hypothetical protein WJX84_009110 [Apatococcus fuscideae]|uniref:Glycosyl transferase CAP10 domain-containing protein n=1 Tax=Apatococcus fuscideae TaxID=2026836 RepID=A0AAW1SLB7_9CHLO